MKKIIGGALVVLSLVLLGNVKANTDSFEQPSGKDITTTINEVRSTPTYSIDLEWDDFEFDYVLQNIDLDGTKYYYWDGNPSFWIRVDSTAFVDASFSWTPTIQGVGASVLHNVSECYEATITSSSDFEDAYNLYTDSSCTQGAWDYDSNATYYHYVETAQASYNSLAANTACYSYYDVECVGDNGLSTASFRIYGSMIIDPTSGDVLWAPETAAQAGFARFNLSLIDTVASRDVTQMHSGDTIGTFTITLTAEE